MYMGSQVRPCLPQVKRQLSGKVQDAVLRRIRSRDQGSHSSPGAVVAAAAVLLIAVAALIYWTVIFSLPAPKVTT